MAYYDSKSAEAKAMEGVHLFHFHMSNCSQRVRLALDLKGVDWVSHHLDLSVGEHMTPDYLAINPNGVVPTLVHDGAVILESNDIIAYLDTAFAEPPLGPSDDDADTVARLLHISLVGQDAIKTLSHHFLFRPFRKVAEADLSAMKAAGASDKLVSFMTDYAENGDAWAKRVAQAETEMDLALKTLETRLKSRRWLTGETFGLADISWVVNAFRLAQCGWPGDLAALPSYAEWSERAMAEPAFGRAVVNYRPQ